MIYAATDKGLLSVEAGSWQITARSLEDTAVTAVTAAGENLLAGTHDGMYRSIDGGKTWQEANQGLSVPHIRWLAVFKDQPARVLAGTEPAGIFLSTDGGQQWQNCPEVMELRDRFGWSLPYSPEAGCVRGFAFHGRWAYAAVEVGGVLVSENSGSSWRLAEGSDGRPETHGLAEPHIHPDVHSINSHPVSPDLVYAPTGGGFYRSLDGGKTWRCHYQCYVRAVWIDPENPEHILLGPADSVDRGGRIEKSTDGGATWEKAFEGTSAPWPRHMVERFIPIKDQLAAVLSNGEVLVRSRKGGAWRQVLNDAGHCAALVVTS